MSLKSAYKEGGMFEGASNLIFGKAKQLRNNMTAAEMALWLHLRNGINGYKIRRQHPIGIYIADFYCHKVKLIIEVDGPIHNNEVTKIADEARQIDLEKWGYIVIRFTNNEIFEQLETVVKKISDKIIFINNNKTPESGV